jgi:hypothetical protein
MVKKNKSNFIFLYGATYTAKFFTVLREFFLIFLLGNAKVLGIYYLAKIIGGLFLGLIGGNLYFVFVQKLKKDAKFLSVLGSGLIVSYYFLISLFIWKGKFILKFYFPSVFFPLFIFVIWEILFSFVDSFFVSLKAFFLKDEKYNEIFKLEFLLSLFKFSVIFFLLKGWIYYWILQSLAMFFCSFFSYKKLALILILGIFLIGFPF